MQVLFEYSYKLPGRNIVTKAIGKYFGKPVLINVESKDRFTVSKEIPLNEIKDIVRYAVYLESHNLHSCKITEYSKSIGYYLYNDDKLYLERKFNQEG